MDGNQATYMYMYVCTYPVQGNPYNDDARVRGVTVALSLESTRSGVASPHRGNLAVFISVTYVLYFTEKGLMFFFFFGLFLWWNNGNSTTMLSP